MAGSYSVQCVGLYKHRKKEEEESIGEQRVGGRAGEQVRYVKRRHAYPEAEAEAEGEA